MSRIIGISRLRTGSDGSGITTLVGFWGCPLKCKYCINNNCHTDEESYPDYTPEEMLELLKVDDIYFRMTGGGITFGGGEPLIHWEFIRDFINIAPSAWNIRIETSLNVPGLNIRPLTELVDQWIIDIKDMNPEIYENYTGVKGNKVYRNLDYLYKHAGRDRIHIRIPQIPDYNHSSDQRQSALKLEKYACTKELFTYTIF